MQHKTQGARRAESERESINGKDIVAKDVDVSLLALSVFRFSLKTEQLPANLQFRFLVFFSFSLHLIQWGISAILSRYRLARI